MQRRNFRRSRERWVRQMMLAVWFALVTLAEPGARAQSASICPSLFSLSQQLQSCSFNALFVKAADTCNATVDRLTAQGSAKLSAALAVNNGATTSAQSAQLGNHATNLADASAALQTLRGDAAQAKAQMQDYLANFMHPGKINASLASHLHKPFLDWLERFPCYSENRSLLNKYLAAMDGKIAQLDLTLANVSQLAGSTGQALRSVAGDSAAQSSVSATRGQGAATPTRAGGSRAPASSITGVAEDEAKATKTP